MEQIIATTNRPSFPGINDATCFVRQLRIFQIITVDFTHVLMAVVAEVWKMGSRSSLEEEDY